MNKKFIILVGLLSLPALFLTSSLTFAASMGTDYLCQLGTSFYDSGEYDEALSEFNKVLAVDPTNSTAKHYVDKIFQESIPSTNPTRSTVNSEEQLSPAKPQLSRDEAMNSALNNAGDTNEANEVPLQEPSQNDTINPMGEGSEGIKTGPFTLSGEIQARAGFTSKDSIWRRANWDLNEKNWRLLSSDGLNRRVDTYDPRIYDRLQFNLDTNKNEAKQGLAFHTNVTIDPWSFTAKSAKTTVNSAFGDTADVELKYIAGTQYTLNQTVKSNLFGNTFNLPEMKIYDSDHTRAVNLAGGFEPNDTFYIPDMKLKREFQPIRELWVDYDVEDKLKLRVYPIAYENQSLTFDDPLRLSNNRTWWEDSPWIRKWTPGNRNTGVTPVDFNKGYWDKSTSFGVRDSEGRRLTALRGFSFDFTPTESTSFETSVATPKDPWQDYDEADNVLSATRLKQDLGSSAVLGLSGTTRTGFNINDGHNIDAQNFVLGADLTYELFNGLETQFEFAHSQSKYDMTDSQFETSFGGNAYYVALLGRFPFKSILNTEYGYDGIQPEEDEGYFTKFRMFASRMDDSFDQPLSSYMETRDDEWWGRHLHFRKPIKYSYQGEGELLTYDNIKNNKIGTGIDVDRSTLGLRVESSFFNNKLQNLFDVRNVHSTSTHKFIENVARDEITWNVTDKLTTKALGIYQKMPKTIYHTDPFTIDPDTGRNFLNDWVEDDMNASLKTGSLGAEYAFFDWLALNGIWEHTNDYYLGYDGFPRTIFNSGNNSYTYWQNGNKYRSDSNWLYNQGYYPAPPYKFYNIFKTGLTINPIPEMEIYLDYTRNEYRKAGQISDNMNHFGIELGYTPIPKFSMFFKYNYSRWQDLDSIAQGIEETSGHHNIFTEFIYRFSADQDITFQYGEASRNPYMGGVLDIGWDPYGGSLSTIDTQHIFRLYYRKKF